MYILRVRVSNDLNLRSGPTKCWTLSGFQMFANVISGLKSSWLQLGLINCDYILFIINSADILIILMILDLQMFQQMTDNSSLIDRH